MINEIKTKTLISFGKKNWIDQNNTVFGFSDESQCCEEFGWGVYDSITGEKICDNPNGLPYHFLYAEGAREIHCCDGDDLNSKKKLIFDDNLKEFSEITDIVQVTLIPDDGKGNPYIFQCFTQHNGYYYHSFDFRKKSPLENRPRLFIIRGLPGSGKTSLAKKYFCFHIEGDMFAIRGGVYHWNDFDASGLRALVHLDETIEFAMRKQIDIVVSSVLPYCSAKVDDPRGHTLFNLLESAKEHDYEMWMVTKKDNYGNVHGCPDEVYRDIFLSENKLIKQLKEFFGEKFVDGIHRCEMPVSIVVHNETK